MQRPRQSAPRSALTYIIDGLWLTSKRVAECDDDRRNAITSSLSSSRLDESVRHERLLTTPCGMRYLASAWSLHFLKKKGIYSWGPAVPYAYIMQARLSHQKNLGLTIGARAPKRWQVVDLRAGRIQSGYRWCVSSSRPSHVKTRGYTTH